LDGISMPFLKILMQRGRNVKGIQGEPPIGSAGKTKKRTPEDQSLSPCLLLSAFRSPSDRKALTRFSLEEKTGSRPFH
jgi:hypothetical protein